MGCLTEMRAKNKKSLTKKDFLLMLCVVFLFFIISGGFRRKLRQRERRLHKCEFEIWAIKILIILVELSWSVIFVDFFLISHIFLLFFSPFWYNLISFTIRIWILMDLHELRWTSRVTNFSWLFFSAAELPWNFWTRQRKLFNVNSNVNFSVSFHYSSRLSLGLIITKKKIFISKHCFVYKKNIYIQIEKEFFRDLETDGWANCWTFSDISTRLRWGKVEILLPFQIHFISLRQISHSCTHCSLSQQHKEKVEKGTKEDSFNSVPFMRKNSSCVLLDNFLLVLVTAYLFHRYLKYLI